MKFCAKCSRTLPDESFHKRGEILQSWCKECRKAFDAGFYVRNKARIYETKKAWKIEMREWYDSLKKDKPCSDCGGIFHIQAMHWDHLPGFKKVKCLSAMMQMHDKKGILEEVGKCELVCANCHAVRTFNRRLA